MKKDEQIILWEKNLFEAIKDISNNDFQNDAWLGKNPNLVSSFDEINNVLFDDFDFVNYITYYNKVNGEDKFYRLMVELEQLMSNYRSPGHDRLILLDPDWNFITDKAKEILIIFNDHMK